MFKPRHLKHYKKYGKGVLQELVYWFVTATIVPAQ